MASTFTGADQVAANIAKAVADLRRRAIAATRPEAEAILQAALPHVPVDTGRLRDSGHVVDTPDGAAIVFDAPYAALVHEDMEAHHANGGPKFLENAATAAARDLPARLGARVRAGD